MRNLNTQGIGNFKTCRWTENSSENQRMWIMESKSMNGNKNKDTTSMQ